jgi:phage terminase large subunit
MTEVTFEYEPRAQFEPLHLRSERWACMVVHRRGGKTVACINELITRASYTNKKNARYAYVAPFYRQAKDVAWEYLKEFGGGVIVKVRESELRVELFNGAWITLYGADNPDTLRGLYLDGVVLDEYGDCRPSLWGTVVLPCLADRKGWAVFIGTPKGKNHFHKVYKRSQAEDGWYSLTLKSSESGLIDEDELKELKAQMTPEEYMQEMECDFEAAVKGTYYASRIQEMEHSGQIGPDVAKYDPAYKVSVASDLGKSDSTACWFYQKLPSGISIIDYHEAQGKELSYYFSMFDNKGYDYDEIWLPHDAKAHTLSTKMSTAEQFIEHFKLNHPDACVAVVPKLAVQHGIDAVRKLLQVVLINSVLCYGGVEALRAYRRSYNELTKAFLEKPFHDWSSNGADGIRYLALVCGLTDVTERAEKPTLIRAPSYKLDDLWAAREHSPNRFEKMRM